MILTIASEPLLLKETLSAFEVDTRTPNDSPGSAIVSSTIVTVTQTGLTSLVLVCNGPSIV